jgi:hypothetical protein
VLSQTGGASLAWVDSMTLAPVNGKRVVVGGTQLLARSRDGSRIALAGAESALIRIVDLKRMRLVGVLRLGSGRIPAGLWAAPDRLVAVRANERSEIVIVAPRTLRLREQRSLGGPVLDARATADGIVVLLGRDEGISPLRVAVIGADGTTRSVELPLSGGSTFVEQSGVGLQAYPGLAIDPSGRRAAVVAAGGIVAEVDLDSLVVTLQHTAERTTAAAQKLMSGWAGSSSGRLRQHSR